MDLIILIIAIAAIIGALWIVFEQTECPVCKHETVEVGFEGWRRKCLHCGWANDDNIVLNDEFLEQEHDHDKR